MLLVYLSWWSMCGFSMAIARLWNSTVELDTSEMDTVAVHKCSNILRHCSDQTRSLALHTES